MKKIIMLAIALTMLVGVVASQSANAQTTPIPKVPQHEKLIKLAGFSCLDDEKENFDVVVPYMFESLGLPVPQSEAKIKKILTKTLQRVASIVVTVYFTCDMNLDLIELIDTYLKVLPIEKYEYLYSKTVFQLVFFEYDSHLYAGSSPEEALEMTEAGLLNDLKKQDTNGEHYTAILAFYRFLEVVGDENESSRLAKKYKKMADEMLRLKKVKGFIARQEEWHWQEDDKTDRYIEHVLNMD